MNSFEELIVVAGPTASGKTSFALNLAKELNAVLINADSMQVYRGMNIGTNKGEIKRLRELGIKIFPSAKLRNGNIKRRRGGDENKSVYEIDAYEVKSSGVVGYMFDAVEPDEDFSVADFQFLTNELINRIRQDGKIPILVGGTGLYIDAIIYNYSFPKVEENLELRIDATKLSVEQLYDKLYDIAPKVALELNGSDRFNKRRLIRRIEQAKVGNSRGVSNKMIPHIMYYPNFERDVLYQRINNRVEEMFNEGLVLEVKELSKKGFKECKTMQGMGYKEVVDYLEGKSSFEEAKAKIKQAHRNYASRQITWFENGARGYNLVKVSFEDL